MKPYYETNTEEILKSLESSVGGLTSGEVELRLKKFGPNKLPEKKQKSYFQIFFSQFKSPLIYILFSVAVVVFFLQETSDSVIIFVILLFNAIIGSFHEGKAQNTLKALRQFVETKALVIRNKEHVVVSDIDIVPGDIVILEEGDKVPADLRVIKSNGLRIDESALTGESEPVYKIEEVIEDEGLSIADQKNMAFKSTHVVAGNGECVVVATGLRTEIGKISTEIISVDEGSPLKTDIAILSKLIIWVVVSICASLFVIGIIQEKPIREMLVTTVALAVSIIPEGLPIVMTLVLATGVWRMTKKNALVKKLQAVEALGQAKVIAVDKTGTITKNQMVVRKLYVDGKIYEISGEGYDPRGKIAKQESKSENLDLFVKLSVLSSNARIVYSNDQKQWVAQGDPTLAAMVCMGEKFGLNKEVLEELNPRILEIPFDYKLKYHVLVNKIENRNVATIVGAPEVVLGLSSLTENKKNESLKAYEELASNGLRVMAIGYKHIGNQSKSLEIGNFEFLGLVGIQDTIRLEAKKAVKQAELAGIKVVMITGDNKVTAMSIAKEVGIYKKGDTVLTNDQIDGLSEQQLSEMLNGVSVFARITPEHKLKIINAYKYNKEIIAMTGDGVNDAPSLVAADLGVAMGQIGTEVAKEASDIVLLDDNFGTIIDAIQEGRNIYLTIKRVILYLFSTSIGEVLTIAGALILDLPLPILASQIIWLNFVTDGFLDISLGMEPREEGLLSKQSYKPKKYLVDKQMIYRMLVMAIPMMVGSIFIFKMYFQTDMVKAWTMTLTLMAVFQWFNAWNCRHESKSIFQMKIFSNSWLVFSTLIVFLLQIFAVYNPFMQKYLHTTGLNIHEWLLIAVIASTIIVCEEIRKLISRSYQGRVGSGNLKHL